MMSTIFDLDLHAKLPFNALQYSCEIDRNLLNWRVMHTYVLVFPLGIKNTLILRHRCMFKCKRN